MCKQSCCYVLWDGPVGVKDELLVPDHCPMRIAYIYTCNGARSMASACTWRIGGGAYSLIRVLRALSRATSLSPSQQQEHRKQRQQRRI